MELNYSCLCDKTRSRAGTAIIYLKSTLSHKSKVGLKQGEGGILETAFTNVHRIKWHVKNVLVLWEEVLSVFSRMWAELVSDLGRALHVARSTQRELCCALRSYFAPSPIKPLQFATFTECYNAHLAISGKHGSLRASVPWRESPIALPRVQAGLLRLGIDTY